MSFLNTTTTYFFYPTLFITGAAILIIEITGTRVLSPFYGSTIFVWSSLITITLGFLALGYFIGGFIADKYPKAQWFYAIIFLGGATALLLIKLSQPLLVFSNQFGLRGGSIVAALTLFAVPFFLLSMASPFAIRLRAYELQHTGHTSGVIFGVSTIGSLAGALLTGFYLIPNFFVSNIFSVAAVVVMSTAIVGLLLEKSSRRLILASFVLLAVLIFMPFSRDQGRGAVSVIHREPSFYGQIQVQERGGVQCLSVNGQNQTCITVADGKQALAYGALIDTMFEGDFRFANALIIGLGGGVLVRDLQDNFNTIDAVEIDPKMTQVAKEFFGYSDIDPRLTTYIADGRNYIRNLEAQLPSGFGGEASKSGLKEYHVVILDAFSGSSPVPHLYTKEAFQEIKNIMHPEGALVVNTIGRPYGKGETLQHSVFKTLSQVFPHVVVISTENIKEDPEAFGNVLFIASASAKKPPIREEFIAGYTSENTKQGVLLTDAYNPIETLALSIQEESQKIYQQFWSIL